MEPWERRLQQLSKRMGEGEALSGEENIELEQLLLWWHSREDDVASKRSEDDVASRNRDWERKSVAEGNLAGVMGWAD